MNRRRIPAVWIAVLALCIVAEPRAAHAYLDPSTGSMLLSGLISLLVTIGFALQSVGYKLLGWLRPRREKSAERSDIPREERGAGESIEPS